MPGIRLIAAIMGAALLVGAVAAGCNRNRDLGAAASRRPAATAASGYPDLALSPATSRPAEVLAASVRRPQRNRPAHPEMGQSPEPRAYGQAHPAALSPRSSAELARYEPLPEPVPVAVLYGTPQAHQPAAPVVHPSPELAMARAALANDYAVSVPVPAAGFVVPPVEPYLFSAPIPELEPVRYHQRATAQAQPGQSRNPRLSAAAPAPRAQAPLAQPERPPQSWVPSPATAMSGGY